MGLKNRKSSSFSLSVNSELSFSHRSFDVGTQFAAQQNENPHRYTLRMPVVAANHTEDVNRTRQACATGSWLKGIEGNNPVYSHVVRFGEGKDVCSPYL